MLGKSPIWGGLDGKCYSIHSCGEKMIIFNQEFYTYRHQLLELKFRQIGTSSTSCAENLNFDKNYSLECDVQVKVLV